MPTKRQMPNNKFIQLADARVEWTIIIIDACTRPDFRRRRRYRDQTAAVRNEGEQEHNDFKSTERGVRRECVISPDLVNLYNYMILKNLADISGFKVNAENLNNLRHSDNKGLIAESDEKLQKL
ncbi:hypothetical protein PoB_006105700 [Plakobranchus ocellatus]|uniref:Uncharacterized protein n=1 Tax=Plakobranchus ocellatus TaxID=259542 RepID=A0AAV4CRN7_9GAST|nr:hypothetical protein PoB_006105700 [Plakobranchus ocellatus]